MNIKQLSWHADCVIADQCFLKDSVNNLRELFIKTHKLLVGKNGRVYTKVKLSKKSKVWYYMDAVTGTLFYKNGEGLTHPDKLNVRALKINDIMAREILMTPVAKGPRTNITI